MVVADRNKDRTTSPDVEARDAETSGLSVRQCLATGARRDKAALLRFVVDPSGTVVPDLKERLPGRGLWLSAERDIIKTAIAKRLFAKAARAAVTVPSDLLEQIESLLVRGCQERLGLARRAGQAVSGYEKALAWVKQGKAALVVVAGDAGVNVRGSGLGMVLRSVLTAAELGTVFDRSRAVYIALARGPLTEKLRVELTRLAAIRDMPTESSGGEHDKRLRAHG